MNGESEYLAYMLRLHRVWRDGRPVWLASVESPHSGERQAFAGMDALLAFLLEATGGSEGSPPRKRGLETGVNGEGNTTKEKERVP